MTDASTAKAPIAVTAIVECKSFTINTSPTCCSIRSEDLVSNQCRAFKTLKLSAFLTFYLPLYEFLTCKTSAFWQVFLRKKAGYLADYVIGIKSLNW